MAMKNDVDVPLVITIGAVSVILLVVIIIGTQAWFMSEEREERAALWEEAPNVAVINLLNRQRERINSYRWEDRQKQTVAIPVSEAMRIMAEKHGDVQVCPPTAK